VVSGGRVVNADKLFDEAAPAAPAAPAAQASEQKPEEPQAPAAPPPAPPPPLRPEPLFHEGNLRSGQQIVHLEGDVTVLGRVASGAEIVAGGSVHVYGPLQGRAFAGVAGAGEARIFCREARPELLCIGEAFVTAEDIDAKFDGKPVEARLEGGRIKIRVLT
jgi:septum site-determining protein MinC